LINILAPLKHTWEEINVVVGAVATKVKAPYYFYGSGLKGIWIVRTASAGQVDDCFALIHGH